MDTIPFLVVLPEEDAENDEMGIFGSFRSDSKIGLKQVPVDSLKKNLVSVSRSVIGVLENIESVGRFKLKEITLQVEVSANGGVSLVGTTNVGGKGAITLKFSE